MLKNDRKAKIQSKKIKIKVLAYPKDRNPYQELLYEELRQKKSVIITYLGINFLNSQTLGLILLPFELIKYRLKHYNIFHLHWIYPFGLPTENKLLKNFLSRAFFSIYFRFILKLIKTLNFKLIWTVHEVIPIENEFLNGYWTRRLLAKFCDAKIVHAKSSIREMQKLGLNLKNTHINPIGNYIGVYKNEVTRDIARKYFNFNNKDFILLFFGVIKPYKGVENLLETFKQLAKKRKKVKLLVAGNCNDKDLKKKLNNYQKEFNEDIKIYPEFIKNDELQYFFNCTDITIFPFNEITTSSSVILALSFGKPVICPGIGNLKDLPKNVGFFYKPSKKNGLLNCIEKAIVNKEKLKYIGENAFDYAKSLSWDKIAEKTYDIYNDLISGSNKNDF